jgi:MFS family permease
VLVTGAALALVWGLMHGNEAGWTSPEMLATLLLVLLLAILFVVWEGRVAAPMIPLRHFRLRALSAGLISSFLFYGALYGTVFLLPLFLQLAEANGPLGAGLRLLPWTATLFVVAPVAGALVGRIGERPLVLLGLAMQAIGLLWIALIAAPELAYIRLVAPLIISGAGVSMAMPAAQNAVLGAVPPSELGKASGIFNMARFLGGAFGIALMVAIFAAAGGIASPQAFSAGFAPAMGTASGLSLLGAIAGLWQPARRTGPIGKVQAQT